MKAILTTLALVTLSVSSYAGCGKTEDVSGKLKSVDAEKKEIVIGTKTLKLTPAVTNAAELVGKQVTAKVGHGKVESIEAKKS
ncbi:MAG: hypothetical protein IPK32_16220 [Verrucomicrobiaceae bacterium]|nr:hypothetical protein [Verrucomicrobiaceae bacterium]